MAFLNLFQKELVAPERVPSDTIIPLGRYDDNTTHRAIVLDLSFRFDDVLDAHKLVGALERVIEKPGWRKLGARLRLNDQNRLEYHVPAKFSSERRAIDFTHVKYDTSITTHPVGSKLQRTTNTVEIGHDTKIHEGFLTGPGSPTTLADYIYADRPQLNLHIVSFNDATLVTLSWIHTLFDAMGRNELLRAWQAMLEGREKDVREVYGHDFDALAELGAPTSKEEQDSKVEEFVLKDKKLSGWAFFRFVVAYIWEIVFYRAEETRPICIPAHYFKKIRQEAFDDLKSAAPDSIVTDWSDPSNPKPFLSDGDILCAWWAKLTTSCQPWAPSNLNTTVCVINVFGLRNLLENTEPRLLEKGKAYISCAVTGILSFFTVRELISTPLGYIAARIRKDLVIQSTRPQIDASQRLWRASVNKTGQAAIYGASNMIMAAFSNWTKGKMFDTDFSAAIVKEGSVEHARGRPTYITADGHVKGLSVRNSGPCVGRDWQGNYWIGSSLRKQTWDNIKKAVSGMA